LQASPADTASRDHIAGSDLFSARHEEGVNQNHESFARRISTMGYLRWMLGPMAERGPQILLGRLGTALKFFACSAAAEGKRSQLANTRQLVP
jgi:hypothetical protein